MSAAKDVAETETKGQQEDLIDTAFCLRDAVIRARRKMAGDVLGAFADALVKDDDSQGQARPVVDALKKGLRNLNRAADRVAGK